MNNKQLRQNTLLTSLTDLPPLEMDVHSLVNDFRNYYTLFFGT